MASYQRRGEYGNSLMRIGILGGGNISETHLRAARAIGGVEVAAVCGTNQDKVQALARSAGALPYDNVDAFLAHPMDIVVIGTPSGVHAERAIQAVRRGLHVIVEKPVDTTTAKIDALIAEADRMEKRVGVFFQERFFPDLVAIKKSIAGGDLGRLLFASGRVKWYRPPEYYSNSRWHGTWKLDGGGVLMNQAIHTVDLLLWFFGPVLRVTGCLSTRLHDIEVEDTASALLEFQNGAFGVIEASTAASPGLPRRIEVTGTKRTIIHEVEARAPSLADATPH